jgi:nucleotide sugar dehydrogenase
VVALGKIGLPLAVQIASKGHRVIGADIDPETANAVNEGRAPFPGETDLDRRLKECVGDGRLTATTETTSAVRKSEVVVIVAPLVLNEAAAADFRTLDAATTAVARGLQPGTLVSYETTLPVHTTRERLTSALVEETGLTAGETLFVAHSPERVSTGRVFEDLKRYPKLVGGVDPESSRRAVEFYESALDFDARSDLRKSNGVWELGSAEAAELTKLAETTYRFVNIGLANEFARFSDRLGIDVYEVIEAANSQPYSHIHRPGIAVGGHCIPVYPRFYESNDPEAQLPVSARSANESMPAHAVSLLRRVLGNLTGKCVVVLGAAYRGDVKEVAYSGVFGTVHELHGQGARAVVHDPLYSDEELRSYGFEPHHFGESCDAAIVQADHSEYASLTPDDLPGVAALLDGRGVTDASLWASVTHILLGAGHPHEA